MFFCTVVAYAVNNKSISYLGEVLSIRKPGSKDTWARDFPYILDVKDEDNDRAKSMCWKGSGDSMMALVCLVPTSLEC